MVIFHSYVSLPEGTPQMSIIDASMVRCFWMKLGTAEFLKHLAPSKSQKNQWLGLTLWYLWSTTTLSRDWSLVAGFLGEKEPQQDMPHEELALGSPADPPVGSWRFFCSGLEIGVWKIGDDHCYHPAGNPVTSHDGIVGGSYVQTGWWFGTWLLFSPIVGMITQSDFHIFQRGRYTTNQQMSCCFESSRMKPDQIEVAAFQTSALPDHWMVQHQRSAKHVPH